MGINKGKYLFISLLFAFAMGKGQIVGAYNMSPIVGSKVNASSNGGTSLVLSGKGKCLVVTSGLGVMAGNNNGKGVFGASCVETAPVSSVLVSLTSLNVYPNPTHANSILRCVGNFDPNLFCMVRVLSMEGSVMMSKMVSMKDVQFGFTIQAGMYPAGSYVVNVDFLSHQYNLKLIKL